LGLLDPLEIVRLPDRRVRRLRRVVVCQRFLDHQLDAVPELRCPALQNFSSQTIGFMNFALLVGSLIGLATNGGLSDWIAARATKRNRGIREPEMRLPTLIPCVCIRLLGNFIVAFGYRHKWDWKVS
jgi:hypothetical protein